MDKTFEKRSFRIKKSVIILLSLLCFLYTFGFANTDVLAYQTGDDYPNQNSCSGCHSIANGDNHNDYNERYFFYRQCTDFCAWCLISRNGVTGFCNSYGGVRWGNAKNWDDAARSIGYVVDNNPAVGAIAYWENYTYGHVAWVREIIGDEVIIEEYNYKPYAFSERRISKYNPTGYIHIKDIVVEVRGTPMTAGYDRVLPDGDYIIASGGASDKSKLMVLDIAGVASPAASGANVQICGPSEADGVGQSDVWTITYDSSSKFYSIKQYGTDMSLDVYGADTLEGTNVQVWASNNGSAQKWAISRNGSTGFRIQSQCSSMSLDVSGGNVNVNATNVQQWSNNDTVAQSWLFIPYLPEQSVQEGRYILLYAQDPSYEVDVAGDSGSIDNNTPVQLWADSVLSQYNSFDFIKLSNGYYNVRHVASGKYLEVTNGLTSYKAKVAVRDGNGSIAQQWAVVKNDSGYSLIARCDGYALDLPNGTKQDGARLEVYPTLSNDHQRWSFAKAEFQVKYVAQEASGDVPASQTKYYKSDLQLSDRIPVREGYTFLYWENSAKTTQYYPGDSYSLDQDLELHAAWERTGNRITYDANGGENAPEEQVKPFGQTIAISNDIPSRMGYTFLGWSTSSSATTIEYHPGDSYSTNEDLHLHAVWKITNPPTLHGNDVSMMVGDTRDWMNFVKLHHDGVLDYTLSATASGTITVNGSIVTAMEAGSGQLLISVVECPEITCTVNIQAFDLSVMLKLPSALKKIEDKAFENSGIIAVRVPYGCEEIGERAFADNETLVYIYVPRTVERIAGNAFENSANTTIYCYENSEAASLATDKNIHCVLLTDDWVLAEDLPAGATVVDEQWTYKKTTIETMTSKEPSMKGWIQNGFNWEETGRGTWNYVDFPSGFDTGHYLYNSYNNSKLSSYELSGTKRVAGDASHKSYIYWHWTFTDYVEDSNRNVVIEDAKNYGVKVGNVYRDFVYFDAFDTTLSLSQEGMSNSGLCSYDGIWSTYHHPEYNLPEYASWWWFRTESKQQSYIDYQKIYTYYRVVVKQETSNSPVQEGEGISDVNHWIKYTY